MTNNTPKNDGKIRDINIRLAFMKRNLKFFEQDGMEFVNEYGINSTNIVDLAAFDFKHKNDKGEDDPIFYGFEIKSEQDNLKRLYDQLKAYITFFQVVYVITHHKHTAGVIELLDKYDYFDKIGLIEVSQDLEFKELRRARRYKPVYSLFIQNLDMEELRLLSAEYNLPLTGGKDVLLGRLRKYVKLEGVYKSIKNKLYKYHVRMCPVCHSKIYYKKQGGRQGASTYVCYKCGAVMHGKE